MRCKDSSAQVCIDCRARGVKHVPCFILEEWNLNNRIGRPTRMKLHQKHGRDANIVAVIQKVGTQVLLSSIMTLSIMNQEFARTSTISAKALSFIRINIFLSPFPVDHVEDTMDITKDCVYLPSNHEFFVIYIYTPLGPVWHPAFGC